LPICHGRPGLFRVSLRGHRPAPGPKDLRTSGDHLRRRRLELGLSQADLASRLSVSPKTIRNWETGHRTPTGRSLGPIRDLLGYDPLPQLSSVARRLREYRLAGGWTRAELATQLGVLTITVSRWERGKTAPRRDYLDRLLALLGTCAVAAHPPRPTDPATRPQVSAADAVVPPVAQPN